MSVRNKSPRKRANGKGMVSQTTERRYGDAMKVILNAKDQADRERKERFVTGHLDCAPMFYMPLVGHGPQVDVAFAVVRDEAACGQSQCNRKRKSSVLTTIVLECVVGQT